MSLIQLRVKLSTLSHEGVGPSGAYHLRFQDLDCLVKDLKSHLSSSCGIPTQFQVLLLSDGSLLRDQQNISELIESAGRQGARSPLSVPTSSSMSLTQSQAITADVFLFDLRLSSQSVPQVFMSQFLLQLFRSHPTPPSPVFPPLAFSNDPLSQELIAFSNMINNTQAELAGLLDRAKHRRNLLNRSLEFQDNHVGGLNAASAHLHLSWITFYRDLHALQDYLHRHAVDHRAILSNLSVDSQLKALRLLDLNLPTSVSSLFANRKTAFLSDHQRLCQMLDLKVEQLLAILIPEPEKYFLLPDMKRNILEDRRILYTWTNRSKFVSDYQNSFLVARDISVKMESIQTHSSNVQLAIAQHITYLSSQDMLALRNEISGMLATWREECSSEAPFLRFEQSQRDIAQFFRSEMEFIGNAARQVMSLHNNCREVSYAAARFTSFLTTGIQLLRNSNALAAVYHRGVTELARRQRWHRELISQTQLLSDTIAHLYAQETKTRTQFRHIWGPDLVKYFPQQAFGSTFERFPSPVLLKNLQELVNLDPPPQGFTLPSSIDDNVDLFPLLGRLRQSFPDEHIQQKTHNLIESYDLSATLRTIRAKAATVQLSQTCHSHRLDLEKEAEKERVAKLNEKIAQLEETNAAQKEDLEQLSARNSTLESRSLGFYEKLLNASMESRRLASISSTQSLHLNSSSRSGQAVRKVLQEKQKLRAGLEIRRNMLAAQVRQVTTGIRALSQRKNDIQVLSQEYVPGVRTKCMEKLLSLILARRPNYQVDSSLSDELLLEHLISELVSLLQIPAPQVVPQAQLPDMMVFQLHPGTGTYQGAAIGRKTKEDEIYLLSPDSISQLNLLRASGLKLAIGSPVLTTQKIAHSPTIPLKTGTMYKEVELMVDPELG